ncbi:MAG: hypothetical protein ACLGH3_07775 [Actinomycetota bacterium]
MDLSKPRSPLSQGGYESYYLKAHAPERDRAVWLRATNLQAPKGSARGQLWTTLFSPEGVRQDRRDGMLQIFENGLGTEDGFLRTVGARASADGLEWEVTWEPLAEELPYLPPIAYRGALPKTKPVSLAPRARFSGSVTLAGETLDMDGWEGMVGHNWGSSHAERWIWMHGLFGDGEWIDLVAARVRIAGVLLPWAVTGGAYLGGRSHRFRQLSNKHVTVAGDRIAIDVPSRSLRIDGMLIGGRTATWDYEHPSGGHSLVRNCSLSRLEVLAGNQRHLTTAAALELGAPGD